MAYIPVPGIGVPDLSVPEKNWAHYLDNLLLPGRLWKHTWDPEGILSTLPAIATGLMGMMAGYLLLKKEELSHRVNQLFFFGFLLLFSGDVMQWFFPLNKNLWSSSFSLFMGGVSALALAAAVYVFDLKKNEIPIPIRPCIWRQLDFCLCTFKPTHRCVLQFQMVGYCI